MLRRLVTAALLVATASVEALVVPAAAAPRDATAEGRAPAGWRRSINRLIRGLPVGVAVREDGAFLYRHGDVRRRTPASNEKLLLSMAILDALGPDTRLETRAVTTAEVTSGVVAGDLWIAGSGDPGVDPQRMRALAGAVADTGVVAVQGSVRGSTGYFKRDWRAPGWKPYFRRTQVALPTALTFEENRARGVHIRDPELRAARALTKELRRRGVSVAGKPGTGKAPAGVTVASVRSRPLIEILDYMNRYSSNFYAEVLGKRLGAERRGAPGSIAKGAAAIRVWAASLGIKLRARDGSGLSYANRVSPSGMVRLLDAVEDLEWGEEIREALPAPGEGTLRGRMRRVRVHAKTGTLTNISALSGWVFLRRRGVWAEFSILSRGLSKSHAVRIEDRIVRTLSRSAG